MVIAGLAAIEAQCVLIVREWEFAEDETNFDAECKFKILGYWMQSNQGWFARSLEHE